MKTKMRCSMEVLIIRKCSLMSYHRAVQLVACRMCAAHGLLPSCYSPHCPSCKSSYSLWAAPSLLQLSPSAHAQGVRTVWWGIAEGAEWSWDCTDMCWSLGRCMEVYSAVWERSIHGAMRGLCRHTVQWWWHRGAGTWYNRNGESVCTTCSPGLWLTLVWPASVQLQLLQPLGCSVV